MKKSKIFKRNIIVVFILLIICSISICFCNILINKNEELVASTSIDEEKILFIRLEYKYYKEIEKYNVILTAVNNKAECNVINIELNNKAEMLKNIEDPNALLLFMKSSKEDLHTIGKIDLNILSLCYKKSFNIDEKKEFEYTLLTGEYDKDYKCIIYGYSYINKEDYVPTKYYSSNTVVSTIKDEVGKEILEHLYAIMP